MNNDKNELNNEKMSVHIQIQWFPTPIIKPMKMRFQ